MGDELTKRQNLLSAKNLGHWGLWKETRENTRFFQCAPVGYMGLWERSRNDESRRGAENSSCKVEHFFSRLRVSEGRSHGVGDDR
jgi:hypothetical protein